MVTVLRDVQRHFGDRLPCISLDINSVLARHYHSSITIAPTLVMMRGNEEVWRTAGLLHSSEVIAMIEEQGLLPAGS